MFPLQQTSDDEEEVEEAKMNSRMACDIESFRKLHGSDSLTYRYIQVLSSPCVLCVPVHNPILHYQATIVQSVHNCTECIQLYIVYTIVQSVHNHHISCGSLPVLY